MSAIALFAICQAADLRDPRYDLLTDEMWDRVLAIFAEDLRLNNYGLAFIAPSYPEAGQEPEVAWELDLPGMNWATTGNGRPLSAAILRDCSDTDETIRMAIALENTARVLRTAISQGDTR